MSRNSYRKQEAFTSNPVTIVSELQKLPVQSPILIIATDKGIDTQWIAATFNFVLINQKST